MKIVKQEVRGNNVFIERNHENGMHTAGVYRLTSKLRKDLGFKIKSKKAKTEE